MKKKKAPRVSPALIDAIKARSMGIAPAGNMPTQAPPTGPAGMPPGPPPGPQTQPGAGGPPPMGMKKGGSASKRADGIARKGHTKGRMC